MKSAALVSFALLFASAALAAQTAARQPSQTTVLRQPPANTACPVSLRAQHAAAGADLLKVEKYLPGGVVQLLHLTLINSDSRQIVAATVKVHGLSGKARAMQTLADQNNADMTQVLELKFSDAAGRQVSGDLYPPGMTAVLSIDLESVTFADGSTRSFFARDACHVTPDPKMLIAGR